MACGVLGPGGESAPGDELARAYNLDPTLTSEQRNRSVLVVAHLPGAAGGGDGSGTRTASAPGR